MAVPVFIGATVGAVASLAAGFWLWAAALAALPPLSLAVQAQGHRREPNPPLPFASPLDFLGRILAEQFYRFPRFVITGGWTRARRGAS